MPFPSRFPGVCSKCNRDIVAGQHITWSRRERGKASHWDCSSPDSIPPKEAKEPTGIGTGHSEPVPDIQSAVDSAIAKLLASGALGSVAPTSAVLETAKALVTKSTAKKLKDSAQWFDLLQVMCSSFVDDYIRVLLIGPPGTGKSKTSMVLTATPYRVTMTEGMGVEDLLGMFQLIKGETVWVDGPAIRAMKEGKRILIDEIDHHPTEIGSVMYALLDDSPEIMLPTGERVEAKKGYGVIATTNSNVTALPEAVFDRFEAILQAIIPHPDALATFGEANQRAAVENHFRALSSSQWAWSGKPTLRRMRAYARLVPHIGQNNAASCAFGSAGKEMLSVLTTSSRGSL